MGEPKVDGEPEVDGELGADAARTIIWPSTIIRHHPRWHPPTLCIYPVTSEAKYTGKFATRYWRD